MNDELYKAIYKALSKGYANGIEQLDALDLIEELRAEVARLREALEPFADVSNFLESETEGIRHDDVFELTLESSQFIVETFPAKAFHDARDALEYGEVE